MQKTNKKKTNFTISKLAKKAGVNLQTIRYYERLELLPEPKRTESGYRIYDDEYLKNIRFVKNAQDLGFKLEEIKNLVDIKFNPKAMGKDVKKLIDEKIHDIEDQIEELQEMKKYLKELDQSCSGKMPSSCCPILNSLQG